VKKTITGNENDDIFSNDIETPVAHSSSMATSNIKCNVTFHLLSTIQSKAQKRLISQQRLEHQKVPEKRIKEWATI
jgi:hypothetical protein